MPFKFNPLTGKLDYTNSVAASSFSAQVANKVLVGPVSGSNAIPTFRSLVNADLPSGTQALLPEVGTIIAEPWANLTSWTNSGSPGASVSGGILTLAGGTPGSVTLSNYIKNTGYGNTMYMAWTATYNITVGTINATSWGVGFGIQGNGAYVSTGVQIGILLDTTNKGLIKIYGNNSNTALATSDVALSVTAGDVLSVKVKRVYSSIQCTVTNTTISPNNSVTLSVDQLDTPGGTIVPNVGQFSFYSMGGTHTVSSLNVSCNQKIGVDLLCIGDSRTNGSAATSNNNYVGLLGEMLNGYVDSYAGSGCVNQDYIANEILTLAPKNIFILSGLNNVAGLGQSAAVTTTNLQTLLTSLTSGGYTLGTTLFYSDEIPVTTIDLRTLSSTYKSTIGTTGCIYTMTSFLFSGFSPNTLYFYTDGIHPIEIGHKKIAQLIEAQLPSSIGKRNRITQSGLKPYFRNNGCLVVGNANFAPRFPLEVVATSGLGNTSQIHVTNSGAGLTDFTGGYINSNSSNQISILGGYYFINSTVIAATTSGSGVGCSSGKVNFNYFSGATVGSTVSVNTGANMSNTGNFAFGTGSDANSTVQNTGSQAFAYIAKTANYTLAATDYLVDCTANTFNITLPTAVGISGRVYEVVNSGAGTITILTTSSQTFTNVTATPTSLSVITALGKSVKVMSNGANWIQLN